MCGFEKDIGMKVFRNRRLVILILVSPSPTPSPPCREGALGERSLLCMAYSPLPQKLGKGGAGEKGRGAFGDRVRGKGEDLATRRFVSSS